jgi:hypothetical protein
VKEGTSADHQLRVYDESGGDLCAVVDWLIHETKPSRTEPVSG